MNDEGDHRYPIEEIDNANILSKMDSLKLDVNEDLVDAVVNGRDEKALKLIKKQKPDPS